MKISASNIGKQVALTIICILLGFAVSLQLKSVRFNRSVSSENLRAQELQTMLNAEKEKNTSLTTDLESAKAQLAELRKGSDGSVEAVVTEQLETAEKLAGTVALQGPGIVVTMKDSPKNGAPSDGLLIHDSDIRTMVNELFASGAEAVSINGERLVSTSSIRCVGPTVIINTTRLSAPFEFTAIGDPKTLEAGLIIKGGIVDTLAPWGIDVKITKHNKVEVPAYNGISAFKYAEAITAKPQENKNILGGAVQ